MSKKKKQVPMMALLLKAGVPRKDGVVYTEEALRKMAKEQPNYYTYKDGGLYIHFKGEAPR